MLEFNKEEHGEKKENRTAINEAKDLGVQRRKEEHGEAGINKARDEFLRGEERVFRVFFCY